MVRGCKHLLAKLLADQLGLKAATRCHGGPVAQLPVQLMPNRAIHRGRNTTGGQSGFAIKLHTCRCGLLVHVAAIGQDTHTAHFHASDKAVAFAQCAVAINPLGGTYLGRTLERTLNQRLANRLQTLFSCQRLRGHRGHQAAGQDQRCHSRANKASAHIDQPLRGVGLSDVKRFVSDTRCVNLALHCGLTTTWSHRCRHRWG